MFMTNQVHNYLHLELVVNLVPNQSRVHNPILIITIKPILIKIGQQHQELKI